jgi:hypothetical protein
VLRPPRLNAVTFTSPPTTTNNDKAAAIAQRAKANPQRASTNDIVGSILSVPVPFVVRHKSPQPK